MELGAQYHSGDTGKKACVIAIVNVFGGLGSVWALFLFRQQDYPGYRLAFNVIAGFVAIEIGCCLWMRCVLKRRNEKIQHLGCDSQSTIFSEPLGSHIL